MRSVEGLREPLKAELFPVLRLAVDGLRAAVLLLALRLAVDGLRSAVLRGVLRFADAGPGLEAAVLRLPACAPVAARFEAVAPE